MDTQQLVEELKAVAGKLDIEVRHEKGNFQGGHCQVGPEAYIVLNKRHPAEAHLAILADSLRSYPLDTIFIKPAVRAALEETWQQNEHEEVAQTDGE